MYVFSCRRIVSSNQFWYWEQIVLFIYLLIYLLIYLFTYLLIYLFTYLLICLFVCLFVCLGHLNPMTPENKIKFQENEMPPKK